MHGTTQQLIFEQSELVQRLLSVNLELASRLAQEPRPFPPRESVASGSCAGLPGLSPLRFRFGSDVKSNHTTSIEAVDGNSELEHEGLFSEAALYERASDLAEPLLPKPSSTNANGKIREVNYSSYFFPQVSEIKHTVSQSVKANRYNVEDFYRESGFCQAVARSEYFKSFAMLVIAANTVWIAFETDYNKAPILCKAPLVFQVGDNAFCALFTLELLIRFLAFKIKRKVLSDGWFIFDAFLVLLMVWETWVLTALYLLLGIQVGAGGKAANMLRLIRLFRLVRVARAARLLHAAPELLILAKGIFAAIRSVMAVMCLLSLVVYVFAILFTQLLSGTAAGAGIFDNVPQALNSLLLAVLCGPEALMINTLLTEGRIYYVLFIVFVLLALFTIMNMLIGILTGVVCEVSQSDKEEHLEADLEQEITRLTLMIDVDQSGTISKEEFESILTDTEMTYNFYCLGIDIVGAADFAKHIFDHMDEISFADFLHLVIQFRRDKGVTGKDIMAMRKFISMEMLWLEARLHKVGVSI